MTLANITGKTWLIAKESPMYWGGDTSTQALDDDEKGILFPDTLGGNQEMTVINESGLYSAILGKCSHRCDFTRFPPAPLS